MEELFGYIESVVFQEEERGFTVARLKDPRRKELVTLVGCLPSVQAGETIRCAGTFKTHPQHGNQFEVDSFDLTAPTDIVGIQKYLESGLIKGIGPTFAERIVKRFGTETLQILDENPDRLIEVAGIGPKRLLAAVASLKQKQAIRQVMIFLRSHGVSVAHAQRIYKALGENAIARVCENPYALAKQVKGIGFKSADSIAKGLGIPVDSPARLEAALEHFLWEAGEEGHTSYMREALLATTSKLLEIDVAPLEVALANLISRGEVIDEEGQLWLRALYAAEVGIAREMKRLLTSPCALRVIDGKRALEWVEEQLHLQLSEGQREAVERGSAEKVLLITGGPGTGKSTVTRALLAIAQKLTRRIHLAAPTGRAAKRLTEITRLRATTLHSLLEMDFASGGFKRGKDDPLPTDLLIVDEVSMVDTFLFYSLMKALPSGCRLLLVGDADQLPSVGAGKVLKDLLASARIPTVRLTQLFRQGAGSQIARNAHLVNEGQFPELAREKDFLYIEEESPEKIAATIIDLVKTQLPKELRFHPIDEIQVLSPMKKGLVGVEALNLALQAALNPSSHPLTRMGKRFHVRDKVMQLKNNYDKLVFNGDIGKIVAIDTEEQELTVLFDDREVPYDFSELEELSLAYAVSIHKYQGSECPAVVLPLHQSHFKLLNRSLLYTALTRAKRFLALVGTKRALGMAVSNEEVRHRYTGLKKRLEEVLPSP